MKGEHQNMPVDAIIVKLPLVMSEQL